MPGPAVIRPIRLACLAAAGALLLAWAAPGDRIGFDPAVFSGETCLAPDYAGPGCAHFRLWAGQVPQGDPDDEEALPRLPYMLGSLARSGDAVTFRIAPPGEARCLPVDRQRPDRLVCRPAEPRPRRR